MKFTKYLLFAGLVLSSSAFPATYTTTQFVNESKDYCIWTSQPGDPQAGLDAYAVQPSLPPTSMPAQWLLANCTSGKTCTSDLSWSEVDKNGRCKYGADEIHNMHVQLWWDNVNLGVSYSKLNVFPASADGFFFTTQDNTLTVKR